MEIGCSWQFTVFDYMKFLAKNNKVDSKTVLGFETFPFIPQVMKSMMALNGKFDEKTFFQSMAKQFDSLDKIEGLMPRVPFSNPTF